MTMPLPGPALLHALSVVRAWFPPSPGPGLPLDSVDPKAFLAEVAPHTARRAAAGLLPILLLEERQFSLRVWPARPLEESEIVETSVDQQGSSFLGARVNKLPVALALALSGRVAGHRELATLLEGWLAELGRRLPGGAGEASLVRAILDGPERHPWRPTPPSEPAWLQVGHPLATLSSLPGVPEASEGYEARRAHLDCVLANAPSAWAFALSAALDARFHGRADVTHLLRAVAEEVWQVPLGRPIEHWGLASARGLRTWDVAFARLRAGPIGLEDTPYAPLLENRRAWSARGRDDWRAFAEVAKKLAAAGDAVGALAQLRNAALISLPTHGTPPGEVFERLQAATDAIEPNGLSSDLVRAYAAAAELPE